MEVGTRRRTMGGVLGWGLVWAAAMVLAGCGADKYLKRGDAFALQNRHVEAAQNYQRALQEDNGLARDPDFAAKYRRSRVLAAYDQGRAAAGRKDWDEAVRRLSESLALAPDFADARRALDEAKRAGAAAHHAKALEAARRGDQPAAVAELGLARDLDATNSGVIAALESLDAARRTPAQALYEGGLAQEREKRLVEAAEALRSALASEPNHVPAAVALHRVEASLARAADLARQGRAMLGAKRVQDAIRTLEAALAVWPGSPEAARDLADAKARREGAAQAVRDAQALAAQAKWDEAAAAARRAADLDPQDKDAQALAADLPRRAAQAFVDEGSAHLARQEAEAAEAAFRRALAQVPDFAPARQGLARVALGRGEAAAGQGLWGNALLFYMDAVDLDGQAAHVRRMQEAQERLRARVAFTLAVAADDAGGRPTAASDELGAAVRRIVAKEQPAFLTLAAAGAPADYAATVTLLGLDVRGGLVRTEQAVHRYVIRQETANPDAARLQGLLAVTEAGLGRMQVAAYRPCPVCGGTGRAACGMCGGTGTVVCPTCNGAGIRICGRCNGAGGVDGAPCPVCGGRGSAVCGRCAGKKRVPCPTCSAHGGGRGWRPCRACGGAGRVTVVHPAYVHQRVLEAAALRDRLARTPPTLVVETPAEWPYAIDHYAKDGRLDARVRVEASGGARLLEEAVAKEVHYQDTAIREPNPQAGLAADPLEIPADDEVRRSLVDQAAAEAVGKVLSAAMQARVTAVRARAEALDRDGKPAEAVEAYMDGATLLEPFNLVQSREIIAKLRDRGGAAPPAEGP